MKIISLVARREETPQHRVLHIAWGMALGFLFSNLWTWGSWDRVFCAAAEQRGGSTLISHAGPPWWEYTAVHTVAFFEREDGRCNTSVDMRCWFPHAQIPGKDGGFRTVNCPSPQPAEPNPKIFPPHPRPRCYHRPAQSLRTRLTPYCRHFHTA